MSEAVWRQGIELFERGAYWECHEALEPLWLASEGTDRQFYGGVILLAAALHKARHMGSPRGGRRNYAKALRHLALVPDHYHGVDLRELEARVHAALRDERLDPAMPPAPVQQREESHHD
ncbi:MAG TPA: DUF309 domain-containing protein [Trueperaceae bacterium]